ncbi:MAG TPA: heat-inducible transcriptional repressor HrcA [Anaerolineae bacterium]|nr:heat-inducible transcriptional repressor HrcA [Anaerolineae bacterium]
MQDLTPRQQTILAFVIREHVESAKPVSSKVLVEKYRLDYSPATIRAELARLEEVGYLTHPHTSAGRQPTDIGYRYFVQRLMGEVELPFNEQRTIAHQFHQSRLDLTQWMQLAASVMARSAVVSRPDGTHTTALVALVTPPHARPARLKHLQLISTQGRLVLLIVVLQDGSVKQEMLTLAEPVNQETLSEVSSRLNIAYTNLSADELAARRSAIDDTLSAEVLGVVADVLRRTDDWAATEVYRDGLAEVLRLPEYEGREMAEALLAILEQQSLLEKVLAKALGSTIGGVQVVIGGENSWSELRDFSMVLSRYGVSDYATGAIGVLGPMRMPYGRAVSTVRYVSRLLSDLVSDMVRG